MNLFKTYILDKNIEKLVKNKKVNQAQWFIKQVKSDKAFPQYQLSIKVRDKNYYIQSPSYQDTFKTYVKKYSLKAVENIILENETVCQPIEFSVKISIKNQDNTEIFYSDLFKRYQQKAVEKLNHI